MILELHVSHCYTVSFSYYYYLTQVEDNNYQNNIKFLWLKFVPLKCLFLLGGYFSIGLQQMIIQFGSVFQLTMTRVVLRIVVIMRIEIIDLLIVIFFRRLWYLISNQLGFSMVFHGSFFHQLTHFGGPGEFSNRVQFSLNIIQFSIVWVI